MVMKSMRAFVSALGRCDQRIFVGHRPTWIGQGNGGKRHGLCGVNRKRVASSLGDGGGDGETHVYSNPKVYDIAFSFRDFESEASFVVEAYNSVHAVFPTSFLEVGCGPARHSIILAETGIIERCVGVDSSKEMVEYARESAKALGLDKVTEFIEADMTSAHGLRHVLKSEDQFDVAAVMLGTFSHCLDNDSAVQTLSNIADCVKVGGLLILELGHPRDIFQGRFCSDGFVECWEVGESGDVDFADGGDDDEYNVEEEEEEEENDQQEEEEEEPAPGMRVMVEYGREGDRFDVDRQVLHRTVGMSLFDVDGSLLSSTVETVEQRQFTLQEVDLLAKASGWHVCQPVYGDLDLHIPLDDEESHRMTVILQKKG
jgi:SAM-dependent methyltransferase